MQRFKNGLLMVLMLLLCPALAMAMAGARTIELAEVKALVAKTPEEGKYLLVDSRSDFKYNEGHLPWAISIPFQEMKERLSELPSDKKMPLVFYCGGVKCDLSHKAADLAIQNGYSNVAVFHAGEPAWREAGESLWVATGYIKLLLNDRERVALLVDARPDVKYLEGTVPGAVNLPFSDWDKRVGLLPADKATQVIFFCGGFKCDLSHKSAAKAKELGYSNVRVYAEGWPLWKEKSTRAFALVNPKDAGAPVAKEAVVATGEIGKEEFLKVVKERPAGLLLVDVRPPADFAKGHLGGAINIPDDEIGKRIAELQKAREVVFYCNTGSRSAMAYYAAEDGGLKGKTRFFSRNLDIRPDGSFDVK